MAVRGLADKENGVTASWFVVSLWDDGNVLGLDNGNHLKICEYTKKPLN